jgi:hypothetical protein
VTTLSTVDGQIPFSVHVFVKIQDSHVISRSKMPTLTQSVKKDDANGSVLRLYNSAIITIEYNMEIGIVNADNQTIETM